MANRIITLHTAAGSESFDANLPPEAIDGTKVLIFVINNSDRAVTTIAFDAGNATVMESASSTPLKLFVAHHTINAADVAAGTCSVSTPGAGAHAVIIHNFGDISTATFGDTLRIESSTFHMHGPNPQDSGDTDEKLWIDIHTANKAGSFVVQAGGYDDTDPGQYLDDGVSLSGVAFYVGWEKNIEQWRDRTQADGHSTWSAYHLMDGNSDMIGYRVFFDTQDDANWPIPGTAVSTGTLSTEAGVVAGGQTIILTVTDDTFVATVGADNSITTALIAGIDAAQVEAGGWDAIVRPLITFADVVRTSDTVVTITLPAAPLYAITADELVTATIPAVALTAAAEIVATSPLTITDDPLLGNAGGGASAADLGVSRSSGAARRRIVDLDDPRRKYRLPY